MDIFRENEKELLISQVEQTVKNHPISVSTIIDWIVVIGIVSDYGYKPIDLLKMIECKR
ncbi:hypothetical protein LCGC14_0794220 [marine sediment metagenome]|uniref:Uncharacterized protein n=1 Tax=marine sediment metagenome TaxID=412755 RepID=A0A0F9PRK0_9ZZZZ